MKRCHGLDFFITVATPPPTTVVTTPEVCTDPMRDTGLIPDQNVQFSSTSTSPVDAKIDGTPWTPASGDTNPSITVTLDTPAIVKRVQVQGGGPLNGYVPEFMVSYKTSPSGPWIPENDNSGNPRVGFVNLYTHLKVNAIT